MQTKADWGKGSAARFVGGWVCHDGAHGVDAPYLKDCQRAFDLQFRRLTLRSATGTSQRDVPTA